jgi:hypothetical protein
MGLFTKDIKTMEDLYLPRPSGYLLRGKPDQESTLTVTQPEACSPRSLHREPVHSMRCERACW